MRTKRRSVLAGVALFLTALVPMASEANAAGLNAGGEFHPLTPTRIYDQVNVPLDASGKETSVQVLGMGGVPSDPNVVLAVLANVTVDRAPSAGYLNSYPSGTADPGSSSLNFRPGQAVANVTMLRPGADGRTTFRLVGGGAGNARLIVDVFGWISSSAYTDPGGRLISTDPSRILDTRQTAPVGARGAIPVQVRGSTLLGAGSQVVPDDPSVTGVVLNLTVDNGRADSDGTWVSVLQSAPTGEPTTSNVNVGKGGVKANLVVAPIGPDGKVWLYNYSGNANLIVDVLGYFETGADPNTRAGRVVPLVSAFRAADTRPAPLAPGFAEDWDFLPFVNSVKICDTDTNPSCNASNIQTQGVSPGNIGSVIANLTGTGLTRQYAGTPVNTYLTVYPAGTARPESSNVNFGEGADVPNLAIVKLSADKRISVFNAFGNANYIIDVAAVVLAD